MEKQLKTILNYMKLEYGLFWLLLIVQTTLFEADLLPQGLLIGDDYLAYSCFGAAILLTIALIPFSLWQYNREMERSVRKARLSSAIELYHSQNLLRIALLFIPACADLLVYYWTFDTTSLLCLCMVLVASLFCVPTRKRMMNELDLADHLTEEDEG